MVSSKNLTWNCPLEQMLEETSSTVSLDIALDPQGNLGWKGTLKSNVSPCCSEGGQLQHAAQGFDELGFAHLQGWRLYNLPGKVVAGSGPSSALLMSQVSPLPNLSFPCSSWSAVHHCVPLRSLTPSALLWTPFLELYLLHAEQTHFSTSPHISPAPTPSPSLWPPLDSILIVDALWSPKVDRVLQVHCHLSQPAASASCSHSLLWSWLPLLQGLRAPSCPTSGPQGLPGPFLPNHCLFASPPPWLAVWGCFILGTALCVCLF